MRGLTVQIKLGESTWRRGTKHIKVNGRVFSMNDPRKYQYLIDNIK